MRRPARTFGLVAAAAAALACGIPAQAYYHYVHYLTGGAPYTPVPEAYNLAALPAKTLVFFVSDTGPATYGTNDTFGSVLSQIKQAAATWNAVPNSDLRVAFGGLETADQVGKSKTPSVDVVFQDLPGLLGMGGVTLDQNATATDGQNGKFFPISRGIVILTNDTGTAPGPSYQEGYYTTAIHEFGHAMGLQHTWTGAAMSQDVIRNTSRARPLDADDVAAVLGLYGKKDWKSSYGSISGKIMRDGQPVNMASVVAIPPAGPAVSALTNPDGAYTIDGLPPNQYLLYVHPLPPDAVPAGGTGLALPLDANGKSMAGPSGYFQTVFYPGTLDWSQATQFSIDAGTALTDRDFAVQSRSGVPAYNLITYSFLDTVTYTYTWGVIGQPYLPITPAYLDVANPQKVLTLVAQTADGSPLPAPTSVEILGGAFGPARVQTSGASAAMYFYIPMAFPGVGPRHLFFNFGNDIYVLPSGIDLVRGGPPRVDAAAPNDDGTVTVSGAGFGPGSRVFFDGFEAARTASGDGTLTVQPPAGADGQNATVAVYNADGQNSTFFSNPPTYPYGATAAHISSLNVTSLDAGSGGAGSLAMVDVTGSGTNFVDSQVTLGFGTGDIAVRRVWVLSPTHLIANVVVAPNAAPGTYELSVISGFRAMYQYAGFQVRAADGTASAITAAVNVAYQAVFNPGSAVVLFGSNLAASVVRLTLNDKPITPLYVSPTQINFLIPADFATGPAVIRLNNGLVDAPPVAIQIDSQPADVPSLSNAAGDPVDATHPANPGDVLTAVVANPNGASADAVRFAVTVSGLPMPVRNVAAGADNNFAVQFVLTQSFGGSQVPVTVLWNGSPGTPLNILAK